VRGEGGSETPRRKERRLLLFFPVVSRAQKAPQQQRPSNTSHSQYRGTRSPPSFLSFLGARGLVAAPGFDDAGVVAELFLAVMEQQQQPVLEEPLVINPGDVVVSRAVRYGSIAHFLGRAAVATKTHKWCLFFRGAQNEPLRFVKSVEFHLHESFAEPVRVLTAPPFEVHETGWGEFETKMVVHFVDEKEEPVVLIHMLRLHTDDGKPPGRAPVVSEVADDIVFVNPSEQMAEALKREPGVLDDVALPHPLLQEVVVRAGDTPDDAEKRLLRDAVGIVKQRAAKAKAEIDAATAEAAELQARLEELVRKRSRVLSDEAIVLWKPEDFRHVPMMADHDTGAKKVWAMRAFCCSQSHRVNQSKKKSSSAAASVAAETATPMGRDKDGKKGPGRKKKVKRPQQKKKLKI
jgi:YEATS domain-containing protein 4